MMNSIQTSNSASLYQLLRTRQTSSAAAAEGPPPGFEQQSDSLLSSSGLSEDQQAALQSDLQIALDGLFESGSTRPDPDTVKSTVSEVFEKYGIDAESLAAKFGPPTPPPGQGGMGCGQAAPCDETSTTSLTDLLQQYASQTSDGESSSASQSRFLMVALIGFDQSA